MRAHARPSRALTVVVSASLLLALGVTSPAFADDYPSWDDVQNARANEATTAAEVDKIEGYLVSLESKAAELGRAAQAKGEAYNVARELLDAASSKSDRLQTQARDASAQARESTRRAGQLIAQFARAGGSDLGISLMLSDDSDNLLENLGTMTKLTEQSTLIYERAQHDKNVAAALSDQATTAESARQALAASAQQALDAANRASNDMLAQVAAQQAAADQLYEQLATLKGTTAEVEREYLIGITDPPDPPTAPPTNPTNPTNPTDPGGPTTPPTTPPNPTPPSSSKVETAISYARAQLGDAYEYGGSGPDSWDCSGLTKAAYAAAGVYIGAHGSTSQYNYLAGQGRLVPVSQLQRGDLVFYSDDGGASTYHTALYIGGGQMIEAQYEGVPVKISNLRYYDLMYYGARPTG
ncbi:C40 family peptidase [soil metagenome]